MQEIAPRCTGSTPWRLTVSSLAGWIRGEAEALDELRIEGDKTEWLAKFLDIVGECWSKRTGVELSVLASLMPDQNGRLCSPQSLHRDAGVSNGHMGLQRQ
jgi:hypothetical protein